MRSPACRRRDVAAVAAVPSVPSRALSSQSLPRTVFSLEDSCQGRVDDPYVLERHGVTRENNASVLKGPGAGRAVET